jgi:Ni/Fe-hydrogenase subunit HybB-like protein
VPVLPGFTGVGVWGNNHPVMWGWDIMNFIWWVGVAHAGTLISAMLFLTRQHWRTTIGRMAEAMTVFSVMMRDLYPAIHVGRAWFDWFMFPIPNRTACGRNSVAADVGRVRGEHLSDGFVAVLVHGHDSRLRRAARPLDDAGAQIHFQLPRDGLDRLGRQWHNYEKAYVVLCGLCTLLVFTVSSIVGMDFCTAQLAGWHATIFPLYFVIGAVFCGFGMMLVLLIPLRKCAISRTSSRCATLTRWPS